MLVYVYRVLLFHGEGGWVFYLTECTNYVDFSTQHTRDEAMGIIPGES